MSRLPVSTDLRPVLFWLVLMVVPAGWAQGLVVIPEPIPHPRRPNVVTTTPLDLKYQRVYTEITDGIAVTQVQQTFRNPTGRQIEGTYVFPLPDDVAVGDFSMTVDGKTLKGEVLEKDRARRIYEDIVRRSRDPGLLELIGARLYQASIFPIPPGGQLDVKLQYSQPLPEQGGLGQFRHPLRDRSAHTDEIDKLVISVKLRSTLPLVSVFCPSHDCAIIRPNDREATVTFEQTHARPDRDFQLFYQRSDAQFGLSLLTYRQPGEPGFFLLRLAPRVELADERVLAKDIAFVIDVSGSMQGTKLTQAKRALKFCINSLNERDRFNVYAFSTDVRAFRENLVPADADIREAATTFVDQLEAVGGTNINRALAAALDNDPRDDARPYLVVFMTDGQPTIDVTDPNKILRNVTDRNSRRVRFHVLGVGTDVNTHLLDKLAELNRGSRDYCVEGEDLELKLGGLVGRIAHPVLTDIRLVLADLHAFDIYPQTLPDLFRGGDLLVLGRHDGRGHHVVRLEGRVGDKPTVLTYEGDFPERATANDFLPRLWANRKVAYLLDEIRLHGDNREVIDEVVRLAKRYGIVTPYTSALILEDTPRFSAETSLDPSHTLRREAERKAAPRQPASRGGRGGAGGASAGRGGGRGTAQTGQEAVDTSRGLKAERGGGSLRDDDSGVENGLKVIRHVGEKTFVLADGRYVDTAWDGKQAARKIKAFSDEYFALLAQHTELREYFALANRVVVVFEGVVYEVESDE